MKYGFVLPFGDARAAAEAAQVAEAAGWDGFFVWEPVWGIDAWVSLTAAAMLTERIKLGTMLSPVSRMRPWKLASEAATLDNLSGGRVVLAVGLGAIDTGFTAFGEVTDRKQRAELLDEGLAIMTGLWAGQPFSFTGKHYTVHPTEFMVPPPPVQQPHIPIWVVGAWPSPKSMVRAACYDGIIPSVVPPGEPARQATPAEVQAIKAQVIAMREPGLPYEIIVEGETPGDDPVQAAARVAPWRDAGATWWIEASWNLQPTAGQEPILNRLRQGPPRVA
ncbi:MAG: LLM class flavin-dependent oxidoreductase [Oscillochloridaceae bacterium umkhey_bin13]